MIKNEMRTCIYDLSHFMCRHVGVRRMHRNVITGLRERMHGGNVIDYDKNTIFPSYISQ